MNQHRQDSDISINGVIDFLEDPVVRVVNSAAAIGVAAEPVLPDDDHHGIAGFCGLQNLLAKVISGTEAGDIAEDGCTELLPDTFVQALCHIPGISATIGDEDSEHEISFG